MVVNATLVAMVAHAGQQAEIGIYQVGSSTRNRFTIIDFQKASISYFKKHPYTNREGKPIIVGHWTLLSSMDSFHLYLYIHYLLPLQAFELVNKALCRHFEGRYTDLKRKINIVMRLLDLYKPYIFFKGILDDMNTEKLRMRAREGLGDEIDVFYFDPTEINWKDYFFDKHFPGFIKHVLK